MAHALVGDGVGWHVEAEKVALHHLVELLTAGQLPLRNRRPAAYLARAGGAGCAGRSGAGR
jgi:hypothetical protein